MKTDLYTKTLLTVIAIALVALVFKNTSIVSEAKADKTNFSRYASIPLNEDGSINVKLVSDMDVNIKSIGGSNVYGTIPMNLKEIAGSSFYGTLPINIKEYGGSSVSSNGLPVNIEALNGSSIYSAMPVKETH
ncbi:MAG TPA: hypothetical protein VJI69_09800 [Bacteroidia bacterium]|nr:hypothetical protein [Bacteroidia bacterium]